MLPDRFASLSDPGAVIALDVLRAMEAGHMVMQAMDYQRLSRSVTDVMRVLGLDDLLLLARHGDSLLAGLAENLLFEIGAETLVDEGRLGSREAARLTHELTQRLRESRHEGASRRVH